MINKRIHEDDEFKEVTSSIPTNVKVNEFGTDTDKVQNRTNSFNLSNFLTSTTKTLLNNTPNNPSKPKINQNKTNSEMQIRHEPRKTNIKSEDKDVNNKKANNKKKQMLPTTPFPSNTHPKQPITVTTERLYQAPIQNFTVPKTTVEKAVYSKSTTPSAIVTTAPKQMLSTMENFNATIDITDQKQHSTTTINSVKPYSRSHVLSRMQEKINSLECDIQMQNEPIWRGNETHELFLPNTVSLEIKLKL